MTQLIVIHRCVTGHVMLVLERIRPASVRRIYGVGDHWLFWISKDLLMKMNRMQTKETGLTRIGISRRGTFGECKREADLD